MAFVLRALLLAGATSLAGAGQLLLAGRGNGTAAGGSIPGKYKLRLENYQNLQYFGQFTAGGQTLPVIYDTGSFEVILLSELCQHCEVSCPMYDQKKSATFNKGENIVAQHVFGSGPVVSRKGLDTCVMGTTNSPLVAPGMPFWQVMDHDINVWDRSAKFAGIIGLGHSSKTPAMFADGEGKKQPAQDTTLLERVGVTSFSVCLERSPGTPAGWLALGSEVEAAYTNSVYRHVPIVGEVHWGVAMTKLQAGGFENPSGHDACYPSCAAILDSGTSLITAPREALEALAPVLNSIKKDCSNLNELPDITFHLGDEAFALPPAIYVIQLTHYVPKAQNVWERIFNPSELVAVTECVPAFMEMDKMTSKWGPVWILGMPFLRYYTVVFRREPKSVHIAYADAQCEPSSMKPSIFNSPGNSVSFSARGANATGAAVGAATAASAVAHASLPADSGGWGPDGFHGPGFRVPEWMKGVGELIL